MTKKYILTESQIESIIYDDSAEITLKSLKPVEPMTLEEENELRSYLLSSKDKLGFRSTVKAVYKHYFGELK